VEETRGPPTKKSEFWGEEGRAGGEERRNPLRETNFSSSEEGKVLLSSSTLKTCISYSRMVGVGRKTSSSRFVRSFVGSGCVSNPARLSQASRFAHQFDIEKEKNQG